MKRLLLLISLFYGLHQAAAQSSYSPAIKVQIQQVENNLAGRVIVDKPYNLQERMAHFKVKGLSMAVVHNYQVIWAKGYGWADEKEKRPVTTATLFKPGSISKSLNAVGVLRLAQDGQLDLYKDINDYLNSWKFPYDSLSKGKKISWPICLVVLGGYPYTGAFQAMIKR